MADQDPSIGSVGCPTLRDVLDARPVTARRALEIALALTNELRRCRDAGSFFCTLSPDDIVVQGNEPVSVRLEPHATTKAPCLPYASPEVVRGSAPDERAAVWQVGILLFEFLSGRPPWKIEESEEASHRPLPALRGAESKFPEKLQLAVYRMLDPDPDLRIGTVDEAGREILACLHELEPSSAPATSTPTPPSAGSHAPSAVPPAPFALITFIGRHSELAEITRLLGQSPRRLLTLVGPGGVGKSHLAFEAAKDLVQFFDHGSYVVPLNPVRSPAFIPLAIASTLAFTLAGRRDPIEQLSAFLRDKSLLLVLDDFDHLLDGAKVVSTLLERTRNVKVLITSRQRLDLRCESVLEVGGLAVPPADTVDDAAAYDAVRLFMEHARRVGSAPDSVQSDIVPVIRICRLLEGLPLAIEMAAGWVRALTCEEILREIEHGVGILTTSARDVPEHHRSMVAVLSQSWRRLSDRERSVMGRLAVFGHGFRREAAEYVGADLQLLSGLMDRSLLSRDTTGRYHVHELLRQYVESQLSREPDALRQAREMHAEYFARFVSERRGVLHSRGAETAFEEMEEELANIRIGLDWVLEHLELPVLEGYLYALHQFLDGRGWLVVDNQTLDKSVKRLRLADAADPSAGTALRRLLGITLVFQGDTQQALGKFGSARVLYEEGLGILREHGNSTDLAMALLGLGGNAGREGLYDQAATLLEEALRQAADCGGQRILAQCCDAMGNIAMYQGKYASAQEWHAKCLSLLGESGNRRTVAMALNNLGNASYCLGDMVRARQHYQEALAVNREIRSRRGIRTALGNLGNVAISLDDHFAALRFYRQSLEVAREMGDEHGIAHSLYQLGAAETAAGNHGEAKRLGLESLEIHERTGERRGRGLSLVLLAQVCLGLGENAEATTRVDAGVNVFRELGEQWGLSAALEVAGDAHWASGAVREAVEVYREGLHIAAKIAAWALILGFTTRLARVMRGQGAPERAALLYAFVLVSSQAELKTRREASEALRTLEREIEAGALEVIRARARTLTLESLIAEMEAGLATLSLAPRSTSVS